MLFVVKIKQSKRQGPSVFGNSNLVIVHAWHSLTQAMKQAGHTPAYFMAWANECHTAGYTGIEHA